MCSRWLMHVNLECSTNLYFCCNILLASMTWSAAVEGDAEHGCMDASAWLRGFISAESSAPGGSAGHCRLLINTPKEQVLCNLIESKHLNCTPEVTRYVYIFQVKQERYFSASCLKVTQPLTLSERLYSRKSFVMRLLSWWSQITQLVRFFFMPLYTSLALLVRVYLPRNSRLVKNCGHT